MGKNNNRRTFLRIIAIDIKSSTLWKKYLFLLPMESRNKVLAFHYEMDRRRAFASELLKYYYLPCLLKVRREEVVIRSDQNHRLYLSGCLDHYDFNISHSYNYVIMVVTKGFRVGVDIEYIDSRIDTREISKIVFSEREEAMACESQESFYLLWTKKESLFKAVGKGFLDEAILKKTYLDLFNYQIEPFSGAKIFSLKVFKHYILSISLLHSL